ncbi:GNAT family N-acetyltransferase [Microlunatus panaciterrae]|uniref:Ribosomal protein S18 acetylase RimI-like enzyme n=1 Tax=Microlunatus panaciterrae TaxID=400768 RepID=A0ABS2RK32_9ACTN|nr:GNAT family N-acetyltransferase [Microlunatus panaciterrae]MBM7798541.1 ribosomal protein S18 acetylase RimI-like enzyme [Microlunatus panaciterrae]
MSVLLSPLTDADVQPLARLHRKAFPGFFLSTLGEPFLVQFYRGFLSDDDAVTVVAHDGSGAVQGAVVGTTQPAGFFGRLVRNRWPGFAAASVRAALTNPRAVPRLLRAVTYRGDTPEGADGALLSSICVDPGVRGTGLGRRLLAAWVAEVASRGTDKAFLTTDAVGNDAVNRFYQAAGWVLSDRFETREGRPMNRYTISVNGN